MWHARQGQGHKATNNVSAIHVSRSASCDAPIAGDVSDPAQVVQYKYLELRSGMIRHNQTPEIKRTELNLTRFVLFCWQSSPQAQNIDQVMGR